MKFLLTRTSLWGDDNPLSDDPRVHQLEYSVVDERRFKSPEEHDAALGPKGDPWLSKGSNHRLTKDGIARDLRREKTWFIDLDWSDLEEFVEQHGEVVIGYPWNLGILEHTSLMLEIYDGYRE